MRYNPHQVEFPTAWTYVLSFLTVVLIMSVGMFVLVLAELAAI